ncbi:MAG: class II fructose-bisphosphate aldolase [Pontiella sp.]|nr:class II fructose-bisphosphate aldolase [Pontiella sp.]MBT8046084.1 class II fructose-bisphosphate aldolase [Pontiella sp.]NNJ70956.1 class II fructose-bisphosphate aldolase [Kiritimatiellales bacterium]
MLATSAELMKDAQEKKYAVPAINTQGGNYDIMRACVDAAEEVGSPMMLAMYVANVHHYGMDGFANLGQFLGKKSSKPVVLHLDHGDTYENCCKAADLGFTSVMLDCSTDSLEENIKKTNAVIEMAHSKGVSVEAEVGELARLDASGTVADNKNLASVEDVKRFTAECQPDMLAVGIGNAHGFYKGDPDIRLDVLEEIRNVTDIPLVLHGSTGMAEDVVKKAIELGMCKINFGTLIRHKYMEFYKEGIDTLDHNAHSWKVAQYACNKLKDVVKDIITLSGSAGRY